MRIRQAWITGLIQRVMRLGKGHNLIGQMVYNNFQITEQGEDYLTECYEVNLPPVTTFQQVNHTSNPGNGVVITVNHVYVLFLLPI